MALRAIGAEQLRRCLAGSKILRRRGSACVCRRESKNKNRDLLHLPATPGSLSGPVTGAVPAWYGPACPAPIPISLAPRHPDRDRRDKPGDDAAEFCSVTRPLISPFGR